ncbi:MAG TPA: hypothetical protein ACFYEF_08550 [Candidatus Wunengus sp. YC63]|uniref:hypothetical protein n=1 Tax=unclassified Candidatus Wunengus TaxID=3367695 RepID=UPI00402874C0
MPIDKKPAVIVPKLFVVELPTYNAEAKLEVFVPIRTGPVIVADPVAVIVFAVIEPALSTLNTSPVIAKIEAVNEPVEVMVVAVIEPAVSTLKPPALPAVIDPVVVNVDTVVEPALIVPVVLMLLVLPKDVAVIPVREEPSPENFAAVTVPFANISARNRTVVVPWRPVFALIVPIDRNPAVIVPKLPDVAEPTYSAEFKVEVFVPMRTAPSFLTSNTYVPELFLALSDEAELAVDEPTMVSIADCVVVPMLTVAEPTYSVLVPPATLAPLTTLNALEVPRITSRSAALIKP